MTGQLFISLLNPGIDLLFAAANYARKLGIDPEEALRRANRKFEQRFRKIEQVSGFEEMSLEEKEGLWQSAKQTD